MDGEWTVVDNPKPIPKWKLGLWIWRVEDMWRLRLYRPWSKSPLVEVMSEEILWALYCLGIGARWWK